MSDAELLRTLEDGVLSFTINRPERGNALPWYLRDRLVQKIGEAHGDLAVRCIVLTATGDKHFCTGADLSVPNPARTEPDDAPERPVGRVTDLMRNGFPKLVRTIQLCEKPVIVALNGTAAGGGASLVLAADLVIAAEHAEIIQVFVRRGLIPDSAATYLLPQVVGMHKAKELLFLGDELGAVDAERLGIVNKVVPAAALESATSEWARRLARGPTKAIGWTKRLLHDGARATLAQLLEEEAVLVELNSYSADSAEGIAAFAERRQPLWRGW